MSSRSESRPRSSAPSSRRSLYAQELSSFCAFVRLRGGPKARGLLLETLSSIVSELLGDALAEDGAWNPVVRLWVYGRGLIQVNKRLPMAREAESALPKRSHSDLERLLAPLYTKFLLAAPKRWSSSEIGRFEATFDRLPLKLQLLLLDGVLIGIGPEDSSARSAKTWAGKLLQARQRLSLLWNQAPSEPTG